MRTQLPTTTETVAEMDALIEKLDNPVHRRMLKVLRNHYAAEVVSDIPKVMATYAPTGAVVRRFHGGSFLGADGLKSESRVELQAFYEGGRDAGVKVGPMEEMNWTFGFNGAALETLLHQVIPGKGMPGYAEPLDDEQPYLVSWYVSIHFGFDSACEHVTSSSVYSANQPISVEPVILDTGEEWAVSATRTR